LEELVLPIGTRKTWRVVHEGEAINPDGTKTILKRTTWIDAERNRMVRLEFEFRRLGHITAKASHWLFAVQKASRGAIPAKQ
jgi:hypothetical protein